MRRSAALPVLLVLVVTAAFLVPTRARADAADTLKHWVFFTDKEAAPGKLTQPVLVDHRTMERRRQRASQVDWSLDLDVPARYVHAVESIARRVLVQSRWMNAVSVRATAEELRAIEKLPFVREVRAVAVRTLPDHPVEPVPPQASVAKNAALDFGPSRRQLVFVNATRALEEDVNGAGVRIGFLDTQFDFQHPALRHIVESGRLIEVRDFTEPNRQAHGEDQTNFHGLNVSSVAMGYHPGNLIGPAYGAEVLAGTTEFAPTETNQEEDNLVAGLEWMEAAGVDVVNISLGYTTFDPGERSYTPEEMDGDTGITTRAADIAAALGVVIVTSAGNAGASSWRIIGTPADGDSVIAVGGATPDSLRASFSSVGPTADGRIKPDVSAMGSSVVVALRGGGYAFSQGTSFSSPMIAGVVAQMLQVNPGLDPIEVREILKASAHHAEAPSNSLGWGIINGFAAVEEARIRAQNLPPTVVLRTPYPNPFSDELRFEIVGPIESGTARIALYDVLGREVGVVFDGVVDPGTNLIRFRPQELTSGVYFFRFDSATDRATGSVVYVR